MIYKCTYYDRLTLQAPEMKKIQKIKNKGFIIPKMHNLHNKSQINIE